MRPFQNLIVATVMASVLVGAEAAAQTGVSPGGPDQQQTVQGEIRSIDPGGTEITLTDGTRLRTPPGHALGPGVLTEGMIVIARYRQENGENVMTELAVQQPSTSPPTDPRLPASPPSAPRRD